MRWRRDYKRKYGPIIVTCKCGKAYTSGELEFSAKFIEERLSDLVPHTQVYECHCGHRMEIPLGKKPVKESSNAAHKTVRGGMDRSDDG